MEIFVYLIASHLDLGIDNLQSLLVEISQRLSFFRIVFFSLTTQVKGQFVPHSNQQKAR